MTAPPATKTSSPPLDAFFKVYFWAALPEIISGVRIGFSTDPPLAILAVYVGIAGLYGILGDSFSLERGIARAVLAAVGALALAGFATLARSLSLPDSSSLVPIRQMAWRGALSTSLVALFLAPLFARLPGLSPLWTRRR